MEKLKVGDSVKILSIPDSIKQYYRVGEICKFKKRNKGVYLCNEVWMYDKSEWWYFNDTDIEKVSSSVESFTESRSKQISKSLKQICTKGLVIKSEDIIAKVKESIGTEYVFGDTILRALRHLRQDGVLDYTADKHTREYTFK